MEQPFAAVLQPEIVIDARDVLTQMQKMNEPSIPTIEEMSRIVDESQPLLRPSAVINTVELQPGDSDGEVRAVMSDGVIVLNLTPAGVRYCLFPCVGMFYVCTVGNVISTAIEELAASDPVGSRLMAMVAIRATGLAREYVARIASDVGRERDVRIGPMMQPGSLVCWDLSEQTKVVDIAGARRIDGLSVRPEGFIDPPYTISGFIPIGSRYARTFAYSLCHQCHLVECAFRRETTDIEDI